MQVIESLESQKNIQAILTTHSPNLASKVKLEDMTVFSHGSAFPLRSGFTELTEPNRTHLEWFLDVTKSNLFFAQGVIMVEGWSEEILLPALAARMKQCDVIRKDLTESGVSVVNVGSTAFLHFSRIFLRKTKPEMPIPVAIVRDVDVPAYEKMPRLNAEGKPEHDPKGKTVYDYLPRDPLGTESQQKAEKLVRLYARQCVRPFIAPMWTLEYCLLKSRTLSGPFVAALKQTHRLTDETDTERELARKLVDGTLRKTELAHTLAAKLTDPDLKIDLRSSANDVPIAYLLEAIKYATRHRDL
jgi:putative ATP-dependent endonuclease of OLD family